MKRWIAAIVPALSLVLPLTGSPAAGAFTWPTIETTYSDTPGEALMGFDLEKVGVAYRGSAVSLSASVWHKQILDTPEWENGNTAIVWLLDTTGAGTPNFEVDLYQDGDDMVAEVADEVTGEIRCEALASAAASSSTVFTARFPASCIDTPAGFALAAAILSTDGTTITADDLAPDEGWGLEVTHTPGRSGYWMLGKDGSVYPFGDARSFGQVTVGTPFTGGLVDIEPTPDGGGYWVLSARGGIYTFGDARSLGSLNAPVLGNTGPSLQPGETAASLSATPTGAGYWIFTSKGRVVAFGDAESFGDLAGTTLNGPILDSIVTPTGQGYYMVGSDGGIFSFGDAKFRGSMGDVKLNAPVQSLVPDPDGVGYWLVASDGGIFAFEAGFRGSLGGVNLNKPISGMVPYGNGYLMVGEDGGIFNFSDKPFSGSLGGNPPSSAIVSVAVFDEG